MASRKRHLEEGWSPQKAWPGEGLRNNRQVQWSRPLSTSSATRPKVTVRWPLSPGRGSVGASSTSSSGFLEAEEVGARLPALPELWLHSWSPYPRLGSQGLLQPGTKLSTPVDSPGFNLHSAKHSMPESPSCDFTSQGQQHSPCSKARPQATAPATRPGAIVHCSNCQAWGCPESFRLPCPLDLQEPGSPTPSPGQDWRVWNGMVLDHSGLYMLLAAPWAGCDICSFLRWRHPPRTSRHWGAASRPWAGKQCGELGQGLSGQPGWGIQGFLSPSHGGPGWIKNHREHGCPQV